MDYLKIIGLVLVVLSSIVIFVLLLRKNESFFNTRTVIKEQLALFKSCKSQYIVFYVIPIFFASGLALIYNAGATFYSNLSVILGILISMLFAILSILANIDFLGFKEEQQEKAKKVVLETVNSIVFDSVLCLFLMLYSLVVIVINGIDFGRIQISYTIIKIAKNVISGVSYYVFTVILLTLMVIIKRMSKIIEFNLKAKKENNP